MKNPLSKRYLRELRAEWGKYLALFLFFTIIIGFCSGFLVADGSCKSAYDNSFEKYNVENGHFVLTDSISDGLKEELEEKEKEAVVKVRINQDKFREKLINKYKKCCLCNVNMNELLVASHIKPWSISDANEKLDIHNGLLMCPNHDKLFDRGYISFDDTGRILISEKLDDNNRMYMNITPTMKIDITEENIKYIKYHRKNVFIEK